VGPVAAAVAADKWAVAVVDSSPPDSNDSKRDVVVLVVRIDVSTHHSRAASCHTGSDLCSLARSLARPLPMLRSFDSGIDSTT